MEQATDLSHGVVSMMVPPSLMQADYQNIVTNFETAEGGVAYVISQADASSWYVLDKLTATTDDDDPDNLTGKKLTSYADNPVYGPIEQYQQIIVLPKMSLRKVDNKEYYAGGEGYITQADAKKYGTIYDVEITAKTAETEALLKTIKVGDTTLTVSGNTIKGELPYSATEETHDATKAVYAEYTLSKYALLHVTGNTGATFASPRATKMATARLTTP